MTNVRRSVRRTISTSSSQRSIVSELRSRHFSIVFCATSTPIDESPASIAGTPPNSVMSLRTFSCFK